MRIVFEKHKVTYGNLVQILVIGHVVGTLALVVPVVFIGWLVALTREENFGPDVLLALGFLPLALLGQTLALALLYRFGFWTYQMFRPIQIEVIE